MSSSESAPTSPWNCLLGAVVSAAVAFPLGALSLAITTSYANKPIASQQQSAIAISSAVRTLVMGGCWMATGLFALSAIGLVLLAVQVAFARARTGGGSPS